MNNLISVHPEARIGKNVQIGNFTTIHEDVEIGVVADTITNGVETASVDVVEIAASSKLTPAQFMEIFADFGGVYMTRCAWDVSRRIWNYEVIIYAK